jgi:hypothetical protein
VSCRFRYTLAQGLEAPHQTRVSTIIATLIPEGGTYLGRSNMDHGGRVCLNHLCKACASDAYAQAMLAVITVSTNWVCHRLNVSSEEDHTWDQLQSGKLRVVVPRTIAMVR